MIPDYQTLMLPTLQALSDGLAHDRAYIIDSVARQLKMVDADRNERVESGRATVLYSRVHWALTYMKNAGLLVTPSRGKAQITDEGKAVLLTTPARIDLHLLDRYPEFRAFRERTRTVAGASSSPNSLAASEEQSDPHERLRTAYAEIREEVLDDMLERLRAAPSEFLEYVGVELLKRMGYGTIGHVIGRTGDRGIDGMINRDFLGLDNVYLQAKRYAEGNSVGGRELREFLGAMHQRGASKGVFITTSTFTPEAVEAANSTKGGVKLIDGLALAGFLYDFGLGAVPDGEPLQLKRIDEGWYPESEA